MSLGIIGSKTDPLAVLGMVSAEDIIFRIYFQVRRALRIENSERFIVHPLLGPVSMYVLAIYNDQRPTGHDTRLGTW